MKNTLNEKLFVKKVGNGDQNLLFIHGLLGSHTYWEDVVREIDTDVYTVYSVDLLGFGKSPKPQDASYTVDEQVEAVANQLRGKSFTLVGHSMGALVATRYAATHPSSVQKLILCNTPLFTEGQDILDVVTSSNLAPRFMVKGKIAELVCRSAHHMPFIKQMLRHYPHKLPKDIRADFLDHTWNSYSKSLTNLIEQYDPLADLRKLDMPVLALIGGKDEITSPFVARAKLPTNVETEVVTEADHHIPVFHQHEVIKAIKRGF